MSTPANALDITQAGLVKFDGSTTFTGVTTTNHYALVGAASNGITPISPSTANKFFMSNGVAADPSFETISNSVLPGSGAVTLSNGTNISVTGSPLSLGGAATINVAGPPSATTLTNHGIVIGQATSAVVATSAGTSGQLMQSKGAAADPNWTTATYPATAGTNGTILQSDGTNIVNTTATYPSTAGTSGNVMVSDGTNWVSTTPIIYQKSITLTSAQIKALHGTPIEIIPAPGAGKIISICNCMTRMVYGGTNVFVAAAGQRIALYYNNNTTVISDIVTNASLIASADRYGLMIQSLPAGSAASGIYDNVNVAAYNVFSTEITGNAAGDNTINIQITYVIMSV